MGSKIGLTHTLCKNKVIVLDKALEGVLFQVGNIAGGCDSCDEECN